MNELTGCGLGLRKEHHDEILETRPLVPFFEVISENFMDAGGRPRRVLEEVRERYPVALHGVSLSIGSVDPVDVAYLRRLRALERQLRPAVVSDHLCFGALGGVNSHDLLPLPQTEEAVRHVARKIRQVQDGLGRRMLFENISSYVAFAANEMDEATFVAAILEEADCGLLLDVNNLYVNARNHGLDPGAYLDRIPFERVGLIHLAGHEDHGDVVVDTHDRPVRDEVWALYERALERFGPVPTLIERDADVPPLEDLLAEARRAAAFQRRAARSRRLSAPSRPEEVHLVV